MVEIDNRDFNFAGLFSGAKERIQVPDNVPQEITDKLLRSVGTYVNSTPRAIYPVNLPDGARMLSWGWSTDKLEDVKERVCYTKNWAGTSETKAHPELLECFENERVVLLPEAQVEIVCASLLGRYSGSQRNFLEEATKIETESFSRDGYYVLVSLGPKGTSGQSA